MREIRSSEKEKLSAVETVRSEMSNHVRQLARPSEPGESVKSCLRRVSLRTGLTFSEAKRLWYAEWKVIPAHVADSLRKAVEANDRQIDRQIAELKERQARFWALTHQSSDPVFYRERASCGEQLDAENGGED